MLVLMCLAQGHNAVTPERLEPAAPQSRVKHSTTELPLYIVYRCMYVYCNYLCVVSNKICLNRSAKVLVHIFVLCDKFCGS